MDTTSTNQPAQRRKLYKSNSKLAEFFSSVYKVCQFILRFFKEAFVPPYELNEVMRQIYEVGVRSFTLISLTGFIVGLIFTKQSRPSLLEFGATSWLPSLVSIAIMRALAPLVTALIAAGKVGSSIGAELGSMRVTEQIDAMEVSGTKPFKFLVVTRVLGHYHCHTAVGHLHRFYRFAGRLPQRKPERRHQLQYLYAAGIRAFRLPSISLRPYLNLLCSALP